MFLANNIFDIDSALDRLEENLFTSSEEKSAISTEPLSQQNFNANQQQINAAEKNGNSVISDGGASETVTDNKGEWHLKHCKSISIQVYANFRNSGVEVGGTRN